VRQIPGRPLGTGFFNLGILLSIMENKTVGFGAAPKRDTAMFEGAPKRETAMFGAGCFWGVEQYFSRLEGVLDTAVGYSGGELENPNYKEVCKGRTGHAEVVLITFDPDIITYDQLLEHFWKIHDPTTPNRQGPDVGSQYRSAIFYFSEEQRDIALDSEREQANNSIRPIVTEISPARKFWRAEEYHQKYLEKNPRRGCLI